MTATGELVGSLQEGFNMGRHYQRGYLRCTGRKSGSYCWEFLWREDDMAGKTRTQDLIGKHRTVSDERGGATCRNQAENAD
jgi:hypothetical protein